MQNDFIKIIQRYRWLVLVLLFLLMAFSIYLINKPSVVKPVYERTGENPNLALLYGAEKLYETVDFSEENILLVRKDLATFARTTSRELENEAKPVGFTFEKEVDIHDNQYIFYGHFYDLDGEIRLALTKFDKGIIRLSITNTKDQTNIDKSLGLNGPKNELLTKLPIDKTYYSINYLYKDDKVVVAFYEGFKKSDVDEAVGLLKTVYGEAFDQSDFVFNINAVGIFELDEVYGYLKDGRN